MKINITRAEAEALVDLIEEQERQYPLDDLAVELREIFGMCTKEQGEKQNITIAQSMQ